MKKNGIKVKFLNTLKSSYNTTFTVVPTFGYMEDFQNFVIIFQWLFFSFKIGFLKNY
ncbi:MAG: hypothetical protein L3J56_06725 [Bacteroidales bacterium]|nr:hypothetical protein [Bacteroidales bacterium]